MNNELQTLFEELSVKIENDNFTTDLVSTVEEINAKVGDFELMTKMEELYSQRAETYSKFYFEKGFEIGEKTKTETLKLNKKLVSSFREIKIILSDLTVNIEEYKNKIDNIMLSLCDVQDSGKPSTNGMDQPHL